MPDRDHELLRQAARGDTHAFGEIVRRYRYLVLAAALPIVRDPAAAQDVAQDTFVAAFAALGTLRSSRAFPSWLRKVARNRALAWRREQARLAPLDAAAEEPAPPLDTEAERREQDAFGREVRLIVASLPDTVRYPILMCYVGGVSTAEAARLLGVKPGAVRKRLHDGKKKLQRQIVGMAEKTLEEFRLPPGFARRCICGCRRSRQARRPEQPDADRR